MRSGRAGSGPAPRRRDPRLPERQPHAELLRLRDLAQGPDHEHRGRAQRGHLVSSGQHCPPAGPPTEMGSRAGDLLRRRRGKPALSTFRNAKATSCRSTCNQTVYGTLRVPLADGARPASRHPCRIQKEHTHDMAFFRSCGRSPTEPRRRPKVSSTPGDLRSAVSAGSGDPRRAAFFRGDTTGRLLCRAGRSRGC